MFSFLSVSEFSSLAVAVAAAVTAFFARQGFKEWGKRLRAEVSYTTARELLESVYLLRDSIANIRTPAVSRLSVSEEDYPNKTPAFLSYKGLELFYEERYLKIGEAKAKIYASLLQAEVLWGSDIRDTMDGLIAHEKRLAGALSNYIKLHNPEVSEDEKSISRGLIGDIEIYDTGEDDEFSVELKKRIKRVEDILRPKFIVD